MSVVAYTGLPGSGKSYGVVENVIIPCLQEGRPIVTNLPLKLGELQAWCIENKAPQPKIDIIDLEQVASSADEGFLSLRYGAVHVFDEVWRVWPQGTKVTQSDKSHQEYFAEHRHQVDAAGRSTEIVLITQDLSQISNWVRNFVDETYRAQKLNHVGLDKCYRVDVYQGAVTGQKPPESRLLRQIPGTYKKEIYTLYQSATKAQKSSLHGAGKETKADKRANVFKSPKILLSLTVAPIVSLFAFWYLFDSLLSGSMFGSEQPQAVAESKQPPRAQPVQPPPAVAQPAVYQHVAQDTVPPKPKPSAYPDPDGELPSPSTDWKLIGDVRVPGGAFYVVSNGIGYRYIDPGACHLYPGGFQWWCHVDGDRVDRATGYQLGTVLRPHETQAM